MCLIMFNDLTSATPLEPPVDLLQGAEVSG